MAVAALALAGAAAFAAPDADAPATGLRTRPNECASTAPAAPFPAVGEDYKPRYRTIGHHLLDEERDAGDVTPAMYALLDSLIDEGLAALPPLSQDSTPSQSRAIALEAMRAVDCLLLRHGFVYPGHGAVQLLSDGLEPITFADPDDLGELRGQSHNVRRRRFIEARGQGPFHVVDCDVAAYLYLAIAEVMGYPIHLVEIPQHNFIRWEIGAGEFVDFETMDGAESSDAYYVASWQIDIRYVGRGGLLRSMDLEQTLAYHDVTVAIARSWRGDIPRMIDAYRRSIARDDTHALALNDLAWFYAAAQQREWRDGAEALRYALRAAALTGDGDKLDTLACAYAQNGQFDKAIETEQSAIEAGYTPFNSDLEGDLALFRGAPPRSCTDKGFGKDPAPFRPGAARPASLRPPDRSSVGASSHR